MDPSLVSLLIPDSTKCCLWVHQHLIQTNSKKLVLNDNIHTFFKKFSSIYQKHQRELVVSKYTRELEIIPSRKPYFLDYLESKNHEFLNSLSYNNIDHLSEQLCNQRDKVNYLFDLASTEYHPIRHLISNQTNIYHHFCPLNIQFEIEQQLSSHFIYTSTIDKHTVELHTYTKKMSLSERFIGELLSRVHTLCKLTDEPRSRLKISLWCCQSNKKMPLEKCLGSHSVNSASTYIAHCHDVKVWRIEESRKVVSHELFHCMGLDFHNVPHFFHQKILSVFNIPDQELLFCEVYVEMWATIFNCFTISELLENPERNLSTLFNYERHFAAFQTAKILYFFGFENYEDFFNLNGFDQQQKIKSPYKQSSSILSYYILKAAVLFNINKFMDFCVQYNSHYGLKFIENTQTYQAFLKILLNSLDNPEFKKVIQTSFKSLEQLNKDDFMYTNLRMTCFETYF